jgi:tetratricopeptide (TPR) repeat protein
VPEALIEYRKALTILRNLVEARPGNPFFRNELAITYRNVASALSASGAQAEAVEHYRTAVSIFEQLMAEDPNDARVRRSSAYGYRDLGEAIAADDPAAALANMERGLAIFEEIAARNPTLGVALTQQAVTHLKLSRFFVAQNDLARARTSAERAVAVAEKLIARESTDIAVQKAFAEASTQLGKVYLTTAEKSESAADQQRLRASARDAFRKCEAIWNSLREQGKVSDRDGARIAELAKLLSAADPSATPH